MTSAAEHVEDIVIEYSQRLHNFIALLDAMKQGHTVETVLSAFNEATGGDLNTKMPEETATVMLITLSEVTQKALADLIFIKEMLIKSE